MRRLLTLIFMLVAILAAGHSYGAVWQDVTGGLSDKEFYTIAACPEENATVYLGATGGLYRRLGEKGEWKRIFTCRGESKGVNHITLYEGGVIFIATKNGLYKSRDFGANWDHLFSGLGNENHVLDVVRDKKNEKIIYLGTLKGMFWTEDGGESWQKSQGLPGNLRVSSISMGELYLFAICGNALYRITKNMENYRKVFNSYSVSENPEDANDAEDNPEDEEFTSLNHVTLKGQTVYLSTDKGVFVSDAAGLSWKAFNAPGLMDRKVEHILPLKKSPGLLAASESGVFAYREPQDAWVAMYAGMSSTRVRRLAINRRGNDVWALCDKKVYKANLADLGDKRRNNLNASEVLRQFSEEPTINEVQAMAVEYAEVHPDKIRKWRRGAKLKAILPTVKFGIDESNSDTYSLSTNPKNTSIIVGPEDITTGWDLDFTWDLSDLIWNESQTSIDTRSKLMVQLRDDIVDEVTRIYFERRRLQIENSLTSPKGLKAELKRNLRVQELTAGLDGLTGSAFSASIPKKN
ncbi:MAG: hypothetical protein NG740_07715 [Omnitrophica bacterium]|nr:hypothetical protein [Candidatus Omnitrophota bacterium]